MTCRQLLGAAICAPAPGLLVGVGLASSSVLMTTACIVAAIGIFLIGAPLLGRADAR